MLFETCRNKFVNYFTRIPDIKSHLVPVIINIVSYKDCLKFFLLHTDKEKYIQTFEVIYNLKKFNIASDSVSEIYGSVLVVTMDKDLIDLICKSEINKYEEIVEKNRNKILFFYSLLNCTIEFDKSVKKTVDGKLILEAKHLTNCIFKDFLTGEIFTTNFHPISCLDEYKNLSSNPIQQPVA